jgi:hypothetical protein
MIFFELKTILIAIEPNQIYFAFKYVLIPLLVALIFIFVVTIIFNRIVFEKRSKLKEPISERIDSFLSDLIFSDFSNLEIKEKIEVLKTEIPFNKKWCKNIILKKLMNCKQNLIGIDSKKILLIYKYFDFHLIAKELINKNSWYYKSLGFYHYQLMDYKIKTGHIKKYIEVKNKYLKSNALIALIVLSEERFDILQDYKFKISIPDELKILDIIYNKESKLPTEIDKWLFNKNKSIVVLMIKLLVRYRVLLSKKQIKKLLNNQDKLIRRETILAIKDLILLDANEPLMHHYTKEPSRKNKIFLLKTLHVIGDATTKDFFMNFIETEKNLDLKFEMVKLINTIDSQFLSDFKFKSKKETKLVHRILLHVNSPYLN